MDTNNLTLEDIDALHAAGFIYVTPSAARVIVRAAENYEQRVPAEQGGFDVHSAMDMLRRRGESDAGAPSPPNVSEVG